MDFAQTKKEPHCLTRHLIFLKLPLVRHCARGSVMRLRNVTLAALLATPGVAIAQPMSSYMPSFEPAPPLNGLYIGAGAGLNLMQNQHLVGPGGTAVDASIG